MRVELDIPESGVEPRIWVEHEQVLVMALCPGSIVVGSRRSEMKRLNDQAREMGICLRGTEVWFDAAFVADCRLTKIRRYGPTVSFLVALAAAAV